MILLSCGFHLHKINLSLHAECFYTFGTFLKFSVQSGFGFESCHTQFLSEHVYLPNKIVCYE